MKISYNDNINNYPTKLRESNAKSSYCTLGNSFSPKFAGRVEQVAEKVANKLVANPKVQKLLKNSTFNKLLKISIENPGLYEALIALGITCTARPLTILATPGAKMEDKQYASAQSIASGIAGLAFAFAAFDPITKALDNILIDVNSENVKTAFKNFYENPQNKDIVEELLKYKIIPDRAIFQKEIANEKTNIFAFMKNHLKEGGAKELIDKILLSDDNAQKTKLIDLTEKFSKAINSSYSDAVKNSKIPPNKQYLVNESLEFLKEGAYKLKSSAGADKTKFLIGGTSKIILFPLLAGVTIWAIPKIMKIVFPNHRKNKSKEKPKENIPAPSFSELLRNKSENFESSNGINKSIFETFNKKPALQSKQVSFSGGIRKILGVPQQIYEKGYKKPLASILSKIFNKITFSETFANRMKHLLSNDTVKKYGIEVLSRDKAGKISLKWDNDFFASNLPQISAIAGSCLYIWNTIRNKEIDPERKPALCTNMGVVAIFSLLASKGIERASAPIFDALKKTHSGLMKNKLNYDYEAAWKCARSLLTTTFAFRYLGPVLATPTADKLVKLFNKSKENS